MHREKLMDGGGNRIARQNLIVRRSLAIGDCIAATTIVDKLLEKDCAVAFDCHNAMHEIIHHHPVVKPCSKSYEVHVNLDGAYEKDPRKKVLHFQDMFFSRANEQLQKYGINIGQPINAKPRLKVQSPFKTLCRTQLEQYPRPWVMICPRSEQYRVRQVPDGIWMEAARNIKGTKFWIGRHPGPDGIIDLKINNLTRLIQFISVADLLLTVDTGPMHIAAALNVPCVVIYQSSNPNLHLNDQNDFLIVQPDLYCLGCMENVCPVSAFNPPCSQIAPQKIVDAANKKLSTEVSCVIPIYQPQANTLNKCLSAVLPQVDEVVITHETGGIVPQGILQNPKIKIVQSPKSKIGFGRNVNFGVRHSNGKYIMVLNDDCYLQPDVVQKLKSLMLPGVVMVSHLLRYPDGRIYYAGKPRQPGKGFYHLDHGQYHPTIKQTIEVENACGCSFLISRKAFYDVNGFDEEFGQFYCEDDDLCMRLRRNGHKLVYTPDVFGNHEGSLSTKRIPEKDQIMHQSNLLFGRKWNAYQHHNRNNNGLGNFDYLENHRGLHSAVR